MPKTKITTSKPSLRRRLKLTPRILTIVVAIVFIAGIAGYGTYRMGRGKALSSAELWAFSVWAYGCPSHGYSVPNTIQQGSQEVGCVRFLQFLLNHWNQYSWSEGGTVHYKDSIYHLEVDGVFGPTTATEVRAFQDWSNRQFYVHHAGAPDGVVGDNTWGALASCFNNNPNVNYWSPGCYLFPYAPR